MSDTLASPPSAPGWESSHGGFLIDGFPRKMDQALKFDEAVCQSSFVLFISTTEAVMLERLLERGKTSGRDDDNRESITKRFREWGVDSDGDCDCDSGVGGALDVGYRVWAWVWVWMTA